MDSALEWASRESMESMARARGERVAGMVERVE
jgi:hypothetical protein